LKKYIPNNKAKHFRQYDKSSWFFRKCAGERDCQPVICVAPSSTDKIIVVRGVDYVNAAIQTAIVEAWPPGIQRELSSFCDGEKLYEFKLQGKPWYSVGKESVLCRRLLMHIIGKMAAVNWRLLSGTNLKGGSESLFFIYDNSLAGMDCGTTNIAMVSLNRHDRLMLTNFDTNIHNVVRRSILRFFQTNDPEVQDYHGAHEFKLKGTPFHCSGEGATSTRQLICEILSALLNEGWALKSTLNVSRKPFEKSVFIFERCESVNVKFACLALSDVNHIRLLNFPVEVMTNLAKIITNGYMPGVKREFACDDDISLKGTPWSSNSLFNLHARSMLTLILKEAEKHGWYLAASADVSTQYNNDEDSLSDYPLDVDSWFFCDQRTRAPLMIAPSEQSPPSYSEHHPPSYSDAMASNLENLGAVGGEERD
jgi:hypothetical protein